MKRRWLSCLLAVCLLAAALPVSAGAEMLDFPEIELEMTPNEETRGEGDELDKINKENSGLLESLGKTDWYAAADKALRTGDWREDLVAVAESQIGYQENAQGLTIYDARPAEEQQEPVAWTALFINWVAEKAGLSKKEFPRGEDYKALRKALDKVDAVVKISRANYPVSGDIAFIEKDGQQLVGIITYVANGYATIIHGDDNGRVTRCTYLVDTREFKYFADLNVLMERAGIEIGKGGDVPAIPEGGVAAWTNTKAVYLRSEPTTACKSLTTVKKSGTAVLVTGAAMQEDGYIWYSVSYNGHDGYIRGDLLKLDMSAIPTGTPATPVPVQPENTPAPEVIPGCPVCVGAAAGVALPVECCYAHLAAMDAAEQTRFMSSLQAGDSATFQLYTDAHAAHVAAGDAAILGGLSQQERVVNVEVCEADAGQQITILFEIAGATAYQWHEVVTVTNADGTATETDNIIEGATSESLVVTAKAAENTTYGYYCVATILAGEKEIELAGKMTVLSVDAAPIVAQAVLGEEINFTYKHPYGVSYQWYVQADENAAPVAISTEDAAYTGAASATLTFFATAGNSGALYSCVALDATDVPAGTSGYYAYTIPGEVRLDPDVLGFDAELKVEDGAQLAAAGHTFQWYQLIITDAGEEYIPLSGETNWKLNTAYPFREARYYCIYKAADDAERMSQVFVLSAQTTDLDEYIATLLTDFDEIVIVNERPITDYATVACQWMDKWNVTLADGSNLAQNVLTYWYEYPDELLCSCVISGAVEAEFCILPADAKHARECAWNDEVTVAEGDNATLLIDAPKAAFPQAYEVSVRQVSDAETLTAVDTAVQKVLPDAEIVDAFDIGFYNDAGEKMQPAADVPVTLVFTIPTKALAMLQPDGTVTYPEDLVVLHMQPDADGYTAERVGYSVTVDPDEEYQVITVNATEFSIFVVSSVGEKYKSENEVKNSMTMNVGETRILYSGFENGASAYRWIASSEANNNFGIAWDENKPSYVTVTAYNAGTIKLSFQYLDAETGEYTDGETITVKAVEQIYVTFNANGGTGEPYKIAVYNRYFSFPQLQDTGITPPAGAQFGGWGTRTNNDGDTYAANIQGKTDTDGTVYYAQWYYPDAGEASWQKAFFYVRKDGEIQHEPANYGSASYYPSGENSDAASNTYNVGYLYTAVEINNDLAAVAENIAQAPDAETIQKWVPNYDPDTQEVVWYVIKKQGSGNSTWHVDGVIRDKNKFEVSYNPNGGDKNYPGSNQYAAGAKVTVNYNKVPSRAGYDFLGWDTNPNAATPTYKYDGRTPADFTMPAHNVTLYAVWKPDENTPYRVEHYTYAEGEEPVLRRVDRKYDTTGNQVTAAYLTDGDLPGYRPAVNHPGTVMNGTVAGDGSLVLKLYYKLSLTTLTITKSGMNAGDSAIIRVEVDGKTYYLSLSGQHASDTIVNLPVDAAYTVTELNGWTWEYADQQAVTGKTVAGGSTVEISNTAKTTNRLHDESSVINDLGQGKIDTNINNQ